MSTGNFTEYYEKLHAFLLTHDIYEQVIYYHTQYPYTSNDGICEHGPINHLFTWEKTPEGHAFWSVINSQWPSSLKGMGSPTVIEVFDYLLQANTPQPYEFW